MFLITLYNRLGFSKSLKFILTKHKNDHLFLNEISHISKYHRCHHVRNSLVSEDFARRNAFDKTFAKV